MAQQARPYPSGQTDLERAQFCAHCNMSATLVIATGSSWSPGVYSWGPEAITIGTGLRRAPGTGVFPFSVFSLLIIITPLQRFSSTNARLGYLQDIATLIHPVQRPGR